MTGTDLLAILPLAMLAGVVVVVMLSIAVSRDMMRQAILTALGLIVTFLSLWFAGMAGPREVTALFRADGFALAAMGLMILATLAVTAQCVAYYDRRGEGRDELYLLLLVGLFGAGVLVFARHFAALLLGMETISVALIALAAFERNTAAGLEAGLKYLIMSGAGAAFMVLGTGVVYTATGTLVFAETAPAVGGAGLPVLGGIMLVLAGIAFKLSLVPFHMWAPDVYQGARAPVAGFLASVSKGAVLVFLIRFVAVSPLARDAGFQLGLAGLAVLSMIGGNLLALMQRNVKRILAYSSISHMGYALVPLVAAGETGYTAAGFYVLAYMVMTLMAFGAVATVPDGVSGATPEDREDLEAYRGLMAARPFAAVVLTLALLALAGLPVSVGFIGKALLLVAGIGGERWVLVLALVVGSVIGLFYYLRIIATMMTKGDVGTQPIAGRFETVSYAALTGLTILLLGLGLYPGPLIGWIESMSTSLG